jgi:hypothetical protein
LKIRFPFSAAYSRREKDLKRLKVIEFGYSFTYNHQNTIPTERKRWEEPRGQGGMDRKGLGNFYRGKKETI